MERTKVLVKGRNFLSEVIGVDRDRIKVDTMGVVTEWVWTDDVIIFGEGQGVADLKRGFFRKNKLELMDDALERLPEVMGLVAG